VTEGTELSGIMPLYRPAQTTNSRYSPAHLLRELGGPREPGSGAGDQVVLAGGISGYQCDLLAAPGAEAGPVGAELLSRARQETGASLVVVPYLTSGSAAALARQPGCAILIEDLDSYLEQLDGGLAGFQSRLRRPQRAAIRADLAAFADHGFGTEVRPLAGFEKQFALLVDANTRKYGGADDIASLTRFLQATAQVYGADASLITATAAGAVVGAVLVIAHQDCLYGRMIGFDYQLTGKSGTYFQLAFYQPIELALRLGRVRVHLGIEMNGTKYRRGATTRPLWTAVYGLPASDVRAANRRRLLSLCERVPGRQATAFAATVTHELAGMGIELGAAGGGEQP
jgi:hypothetical protein